MLLITCSGGEIGRVYRLLPPFSSTLTILEKKQISKFDIKMPGGAPFSTPLSTYKLSFNQIPPWDYASSVCNLQNVPNNIYQISLALRKKCAGVRAYVHMYVCALVGLRYISSMYVHVFMYYFSAKQQHNDTKAQCFIWVFFVFTCEHIRCRRLNSKIALTFP